MASCTEMHFGLYYVHTHDVVHMMLFWPACMQLKMHAYTLQEYDASVIITSPSVPYRGEILIVVT